MQTPVSNCNLGSVAPSFKTVLHQIYPSLLDAYYTEGRRALKRYVYVKQHCMHMLSQAFIKPSRQLNLPSHLQTSALQGS